MKHLNLTDNLYSYMSQISLREDKSLQALREKTSTLPLAQMQVSPEEAQFLQFLLRLLQAEKVLELGTFTGYSALAMALALPPHGELITCDINPEWTTIASHYWQLAKQDKKIKLRLKPALQSLQELCQEGYQHAFDFIFIDADKTNYLNYYELSLELIKPEGVIAIDNVFWSAKVIDPSETDGQTRAIRELNEHISKDDRVDISLLAIADGLFLIKPKKSKEM